MNDFGHYTLCIGWLLALFGFIAGAYSAIRKNERLFLAVANSTMLLTLCVALAIFALGYGFTHDDYANQYIWQHSNKDMQTIYKIAAIWGGMDGSMLLWCFMLSVSGAIVAYLSRSYPRELMPWVLSIINSSSLFFITVVVFFTNPFRYIKAAFIPPDGNGLNPLLQNPYMSIHPPLLYLGFTTLAVPFAFCMGALLAGYLSNEWLRLTRRWTLVAWGFLTAGITMGGHWAYIELGWGGFWAWDPVENASFLPWLTGTAFLHSVMVQERKNMLRFWNVWLIVLTYALTVFGTFLTRSGVVQSVHAFASTNIGWIFLVYLGLIFGLATILTYYRRDDLKSERKIESLLSREAAFLINNLIFLSICFATLWGVMFPILSEKFTGVKQAVGIPFFNTVNIPLFLFLIFMMGVGPLIAWRRASYSSLRRTFVWPFISAFIVGCILVWAGVTTFYPVLSYSLCFFVLMTIMGEFHRGIRAQRVIADNKEGIAKNVETLFRRHRTRYGGYLIHFGVLVATIGITASMAHKIEKEFTLAKNETTQVGRFTFTLQDIQSGGNGNYDFLKTPVIVKSVKSGEVITVLEPELRFYKRGQETTTEVALRMGPREDLYIVTAGLDDSRERAALKLFINPLQVWLWFGVIIMVSGTVIVIIPSQRIAVETVSTRLSPEELSRI